MVNVALACLVGTAHLTTTVRVNMGPVNSGLTNPLSSQPLENSDVVVLGDDFVLPEFAVNSGLGVRAEVVENLAIVVHEQAKDVRRPGDDGPAGWRVVVDFP